MVGDRVWTYGHNGSKNLLGLLKKLFCRVLMNPYVIRVKTKGGYLLFLMMAAVGLLET